MTFTIEQTHSLAPDDARKAVSSICDSAAKKYGIQASWPSEKEARIERAGLVGTIKLEEGRVVVAVDLAPALAPLRPMLEAGVRDEMKRALAPAPTTQAG